MADLLGWLLDLYEDEQDGAVLWLLGDDGRRHCLHQEFPITFYAAGSSEALRELWVWLRAHPLRPELKREQRRDLFAEDPVTVLAVTVRQPALQPRLFHEMAARWPNLDYYDADLGITLRHAALFGTFPLARCYARTDEGGRIQELRVLDSPWDLDPSPPPLRVLALKPDCDPARTQPQVLLAEFERQSYRFSLQPERALLVNLRALLRRTDPDMLLTMHGDTWLLPHLLELSKAHNLPLPLNREEGRGVKHKREGSYFSYGQIIYRGQQILLYGRCHIDCRNAMMWQSYDLDGALETARITALPIQVAARVSPGTGISSMQITTALRNSILVPWRKQAPERPKTAADLIRFDQGGLVYQPITGLHFDVGMVDFISMYPSIMVRSNISPETPFPDRLGHSDHPPGLIPLTLGPLLEKRVALKQRALSLPAWDPRRRMDKARSAAHKWLLVTCFGYLGYKNARFGRIEAHEAVTTWGREALLRAKEAAEDMGFRVLHMYVDGLWVKKDGCREAADFQPLLEEIAARTSLPIALDGVYRWVAFLSSRLDARLPVPNRYFGVFQDGSVKARGIDLRRRDSAPFVADAQMEMLHYLARAENPDDLRVRVRGAVEILRRHLEELRAGKVPLEDLLVGKRLSKELAGYRVPSPGARAAMQLLEAGKTVRPGQRVRLLFTRGTDKVRAWNLPRGPDPAELDVDYYQELMLRAASNLLQPFGLDEEQLLVWVREDLGEQLQLPLHAWHRERRQKVFPVRLPSGVLSAAIFR
jgi:DNA polymerase-2